MCETSTPSTDINLLLGCGHRYYCADVTEGDVAEGMVPAMVLIPITSDPRHCTFALITIKKARYECGRAKWKKMECYYPRFGERSPSISGWNEERRGKKRFYSTRSFRPGKPFKSGWASLSIEVCIFFKLRWVVSREKNANRNDKWCPIRFEGIAGPRRLGRLTFSPHLFSLSPKDAWRFFAKPRSNNPPFFILLVHIVLSFTRGFSPQSSAPVLVFSSSLLALDCSATLRASDSSRFSSPSVLSRGAVSPLPIYVALFALVFGSFFFR